MFAMKAVEVKRRIAEELFLIPVKNNLADMRHVFVLHGCGEFVWDRLDPRAEYIQGGGEGHRMPDIAKMDGLVLQLPEKQI